MRKEQNSVKRINRKPEPVLKPRMDSASSDGLNCEVLNNPGLQQLAMVGQMQQELIKKNTINGKMRMCTIDTKEPGLILEGTKDGKFRFEKESDKNVVEIDPENLELCQDK